MGFFSLERQMFVTGLFRGVSVLMEAQGLWHISANKKWQLGSEKNCKIFSFLGVECFSPSPAVKSVL